MPQPIVSFLSGNLGLPRLTTLGGLFFQVDTAYMYSTIWSKDSIWIPYSSDDSFIVLEDEGICVSQIDVGINCADASARAFDAKKVPGLIAIVVGKTLCL